jgi:uncharacterized OsmC-like protein
MVKIQVNYIGEKHCELVHEPSGARLQTDAPKDNQGRGQAFSPTDLVASALASCVLTTVAIQAEKEGWILGECFASVEKNMSAAPRRVESLVLKIRFTGKLVESQRQKIKEWAHGCPVARSLHPDVKQIIEMEF